MVGLLAVDRLKYIAKGGKGISGELVVGAFDFLKAQDIGLEGEQKLFNHRAAQANGNNIPGGKGQWHGG